MENRPIKYLTLSVTGKCNLACKYCYRGEPNNDVMKPEWAKTAIDLAAAGGESFHIQITGGEPLLAWDVVLEILDYIQKSKVQASVGLQTNGTLIDDNIARALLTHKVQLGVSLDGPIHIHNKLRGKAEQTLNNLALLTDRNVPFRTTTVVTADNAASLGKTALLLAAFPTIQGMALDLLVRKGSQPKSGVFPPSHQALVDGLEDLQRCLDFVNARRKSPIALREAERLFRPSSNRKTKAYCRAQLGQSLAVSPAGGVYPCGQAIGDPAFFKGNIMEGAAPLICTALIKHSIYKECRTCEAREVCPGECPSRLYYNKETGAPLSCVMTRTLFKLHKEASAA
ncbi:radical SAM/SPASM domain-containing protein [Desulfatibacillum aliphaticivorans]|uniref:radical SAM/SPASM domain-containing protein n=1 Tax=Desulfatibacillum aliphaticivorans TaxID=218208 RepID=UPI00040CE34E|nr:radical SAM protein [Desulfatibacillum aliphaticivorans]